MKGLIFNIKRYAIHDGPGIRVTYFLKGCPLGCLWCHNPEGIRKKVEKVQRIDRIGDKEFKSMETVGRYYTAGDLLDIAIKDMIFIEESGGGITFSGGEPLMQADFLRESLMLFSDNGIHTAVDTSGFGSKTDIDAIIPCTDLFLFDLKHLDPDKHEKYTGVSNEMILENYRYILAKGGEVIIRIPVIPGFNDDDSELEALREFVRSDYSENIKRIDLLPYHKTGSSKYRRFDLEYLMKNTAQPSAGRMEEIKEFFEISGIKVKIGG